ncbi:MAG TPA: hypothetical protein VIX15_00685 [Streptosporangiaceae bacterium]
MPEADAVAHALDVPGARLYYERRGAGPLLLLVGSPMDSTGFTGLVGALADRYTVVTYDPRGIGNSSREDAAADVTPEQQADAPRWAPSAEQMARMRAATEVFLAHLIRPTARYRPDIEALQAASTRIVVAAGATSTGQLANRSAAALAERLGTPVIEFPGDHGGFMAWPEPFGRVLDQVLTEVPEITG